MGWGPEFEFGTVTLLILITCVIPFSLLCFVDLFLSSFQRDCRKISLIAFYLNVFKLYVYISTQRSSNIVAPVIKIRQLQCMASM